MAGSGAQLCLTHNLNSVMKLVLGKDWAPSRMKALRFHLIALPGRVVRHARRLIIRLGAAAETVTMLDRARMSAGRMTRSAIHHTAGLPHGRSADSPTDSRTTHPRLAIRDPQKTDTGGDVVRDVA